MLAVLDNIFYRISSRLFGTQEKIESCRQFLTFAVIGVGNTIIDFSIYYMLTRHTAFFDYETWHRYLANSISFTIATTFSFFMNRTWTFRQKGNPGMGEVARFYATTLSGLLLNNTILFVFSEYIGFGDIISKMFSTVFSTVWNFVFKKFWVFAPQKNEEILT